jgi:hypothetical protein
MTGFGNKIQVIARRENRRAHRVNANAPAVVQTTACQFAVTIVNISASGARLIASDHPPSRQDVQLKVNGLSLFGRIAWRRQKAFGVRFDDALHDYSPAEIHEAVEEASAHNYDFDREAVLSELMNKVPNTEARDIESVLP